MKRRITHIPFFLSASIILFILIPIGLFNGYLRYEKYLNEEKNIRKFYNDGLKKTLDANISNAGIWFELRLKNFEENMESILEFENRTLFSMLKTLRKIKLTGSENIKRYTIREIIRKTRRFREKGYFFAIDLMGNVIAYPPYPELEGKNIFLIKDNDDTLSLKKVLKLAREKGDGFFRESYSDEKTDGIKGKLNYIRVLKPENLIIGTTLQTSVLIEELRETAMEFIKRWNSNLDDFFIIIDQKGNIVAGRYPSILRQNRGKWENQALKKGRGLEEDYIDLYFSNNHEISDITLRSRHINKLNLTFVTGVDNRNFRKFVKRKREDLNDGIRFSIYSSLAVFAFIFSIILFASYHFKKQIENSFRIFSEFFEKARNEYTQIDRDQLRFHEFKKLAGFANEMTDERIKKENIIKEFTAKLKDANHKLMDMANKDGLTKVANRRRFDKIFDKEWKIGLRNGTVLTVGIIDIDFFKIYNDTYGHQDGDKCLARFAGQLKKVLKRPSDLIARYGGEEFVILLPGTEGKNALLVAESMEKAVAELKIKHKGSSVSEYVTFSMGIASIIPEKNIPSSYIIECADKALYTAKKNGRNRCVLYDEKKFF